MAHLEPNLHHSSTDPITTDYFLITSKHIDRTSRYRGRASAPPAWRAGSSFVFPTIQRQAYLWFLCIRAGVPTVLFVHYLTDQCPKHSSARQYLALRLLDRSLKNRLPRNNTYNYLLMMPSGY